MTMMGISGADLQNAAWNLAVAGTVFATCAAVAEVSLVNFNLPYLKNKRHVEISQWLSVAVGVAAAWGINSYVSASRYSLVTDPLISKMLKLGMVQATIGLAADYFLKNKLPLIAIFGACVAAAGHGNLSLIGFGAMGAFIGGNQI